MVGGGVTPRPTRTREGSAYLNRQCSAAALDPVVEDADGGGGGGGGNSRDAELHQRRLSTSASGRSLAASPPRSRAQRKLGQKLTIETNFEQLP